MISVSTILKPYLKGAIVLNVKSGLPVTRPLFLYYEDNVYIYILKYQYLLGRDILVALAHEEGRSDQTLCLPEGSWIHAQTGEVLWGGEVTVSASIGKLPTSYHANSKRAALSALLKSI